MQNGSELSKNTVNIRLSSFTRAPHSEIHEVDFEFEEHMEWMGIDFACTLTNSALCGASRPTTHVASTRRPSARMWQTKARARKTRCAEFSHAHNGLANIE